MQQSPFPHMSQDVTMRCADADGVTVQLDATLGYDASDPYAVTATFRTGICEVVWTFARELLVGGLIDPVGEGDVHVWPGLDSEGNSVVVIDLSSPDGELIVQCSTTEVSRFVNRTLSAVPFGSESELIDFDQLIDRLLAV